MYSFSGAAFFIWWMMPGSVATMKLPRRGSLHVREQRRRRADERCPRQQPVFTLRMRDQFRVGMCQLQFDDLGLAEGLMHHAGSIPQHHGSGPSSCSGTGPGSCRVRRGSAVSAGICRMIFSALLDVQMMSLAAFTSAEQLM